MTNSPEYYNFDSESESNENDFDYLSPLKRNNDLIKKIHKLEQINKIYFKTCEKTIEKLENFFDQMQIHLNKLYNIKTQLQNDSNCQHYAKKLDEILNVMCNQCYEMDNCIFDLDDALIQYSCNDNKHCCNCCKNENNCCLYLLDNNDDGFDSCAQNAIYYDKEINKDV